MKKVRRMESDDEAESSSESDEDVDMEAPEGGNRGALLWEVCQFCLIFFVFLQIPHCMLVVE